MKAFTTGFIGLVLITLFSAFTHPKNEDAIMLSVRSTFDGVVLNWKSDFSFDYDYYEIQRSTNGEDFVTLNMLDGEKILTDYFDNAPYEGVSYYRIKFVKINKSFNYSKVVKTDYKDLSSFVVAPKIIDGKLAISSLNDNRPTSITVLDKDGEVVKSFAQSDLEEVNTILDCQALANGRYTVRVFAGQAYKRFEVEKLY